MVRQWDMRNDAQSDSPFVVNTTKEGGERRKVGNENDEEAKLELC